MAKYTYNYDCLINYCNNNLISLNKDYSNINVTRDTYIEGNCLNNNCSFLFNKTFRQLKRTGSFCKDCSNLNKKIKLKETCLNKYGVEHSFQVKEFRDLGLKTIREKYGVTNISQSDEIKLKKANTCLKNFGVDNSFKSQEVQNKIKTSFLDKYNCDNPFKSNEIKKQIVQTNLNKYGCKNPQQNANINNKTKNTCIEKYGVTTAILLPEVIEKRKEACIYKYGNEIPLKTEIGKKQVKQTCLKKYGVENPQQNPEISEKTVKNSYRKKIYTTPSGKEFICQGYEPFALDNLIKEDNNLENEIITSRKNVPTIWYNDNDGKKHRHFVDIFIPSQNKCIEVKSTWTFKKKMDCVFLKQYAAKELGYNYEIWIYNNKGEIVEKHL
jgi:hypothetical protein